MNILDIIMKTIKSNIKNLDMNKSIKSFDEYKKTLQSIDNILENCRLTIDNEILDIDNTIEITENDLGRTFEDNSNNQWMLINMIYCDEIDKDVFNIIEVGKSVNKYCITIDGMIYLPMRNVEIPEYTLKLNYNDNFNYFKKWITEKID